MSYIDFKIDYDVPFGRISTLYENLGINEAIENRKKELNFPDPETWLLSPNLVKCNTKTQQKLLEQWESNWRNYNYDRRSGMPKRKELIKYKTPHNLTENERQKISWTFYLGDGPASDDEIPDDILRLDLNFTIDDAKKRGEND